MLCVLSAADWCQFVYVSVRSGSVIESVVGIDLVLVGLPGVGQYIDSASVNVVSLLQ